MANQYKSTENGTSIAEVAIVSLLLTTSSCKLAVAALCCELLDKAVWFAFDLLCPVLLTVLWQTLSQYLFEGSRFVQILLHKGTCLWTILCLTAR